MHTLGSLLIPAMDSLLCCLVMGTRHLSRSDCLKLAGAFACFDAGASFFGPVWTLAVPDPDAWVLYLAIIPLLACALREKRSARYAVAALLSVDNLLMPRTASMALLGGLLSGGLAFTGLSAGGWIVGHFTRTRAHASSRGETRRRLWGHFNEQRRSYLG